MSRPGTRHRSGRALAMRQAIAGALAGAGQALGLAARGKIWTGCVFAPSLEAALEGAEFVQENGPERLDAKRALFAAMDAACPAGVVIASSSSTLKVSDVQGGLRSPGRVVLGHPFNPPHLIPLVEVVGGARRMKRRLRPRWRFTDR